MGFHAHIGRRRPRRWVFLPYDQLRPEHPLLADEEPWLFHSLLSASVDLSRGRRPSRRPLSGQRFREGADHVDDTTVIALRRAGPQAQRSGG